MVREHDRGQEKRFRKILRLSLHEYYCGERKAGHHDQQKRRQDAESPASGKVENAKSLARDVFGYLIDDQIARDHKKDIDADKSATKAGQADVRSDNGKNRYCAQTIDEGSVYSNFVN